MRKAWLLLMMLAAIEPVLSAEPRYSVSYTAEIQPQAEVIEVTIELQGEKLPSRLVFSIDPRRHNNFKSTDALDLDEKRVTWRPKGKRSQLTYTWKVNHERDSGGYDSLIRDDWAVFRGDRMVPRVRVTAARGLQSRASLQFTLPKDWSVVTAFAPAREDVIHFDDAARRFDRPSGWMIAGKIGSRSEKIGDVQVTVAAPTGDNARRQDVLAFLSWNLPRLVEVVPTFSKRLLIVCAGDPMWRGGLSGPHSLFMHSDRPLISENRTSTLLHELMHVGLRIHADEESDWIVEGLAEYYSLEILRRSGGISERRYLEALASLERWAARAPSLFKKQSTGAATARAVLALKRADDEIRRVTSGRASLDDVTRALGGARSEVSLERLQAVAAEVAGRPLQSLQRDTLMQPISARAQ